MLEIALGISLAVGVAGVSATVKHRREANVLDTVKFVSKMERLAGESTSHRCEHCNRLVEMEEVRLVYADASGRLRVVCDLDSCLLAHTQGEHEQIAA